MKTRFYIQTAAVLVLTINCILPAVSFSQWQTYPYSPPNSVLTFPNDDGLHPAASTKTEWWYINLHLIGSAPQHKEYDVMLVYFRFYNMRIFNISESSGTFNSSVLQLTPILTAQLNKWDLTYTSLPSVNDYSKATYSVDGIPYKYNFYAVDPTHNDMLNVTVTSNRTPLVVGGDGFMLLGNNGDSTYYYSYTNMKVNGTIKYNNVTDTITSGIAWIDRQWGPFTVGVNTSNKYEWFSMQADQPNAILGQPQAPSEYNIWQIYSDTNSVAYRPEWRMVSSIFPDNTQDTSSSFFYERTGYWHDAVNNKYYSSRWRLIDPKHGVNIDMTPKISNQVIDVTMFKFWEGTTSLKGTVNDLPITGVGFAELVQNHNSNIALPSVPTGLTVTPQTGYNELSWTASTAGTYPVGGYRIFRSPNNNGYWQYLATTTNLSYNDNSAQPDSSYYYSVTSFDNQTATSASNYATAVYASPLLGVNYIYGATSFLKTFPNPSTGKFTVTNSSSNLIVLEIYNVLGEKVYVINNLKQQAVNEIDISKSPKGMYFVKIYTGEKIYSEKIVIQ